MVTSAPYGSSRSRFFVSYGLHGLQNFITHLPGKYACHEIRNLPVAGGGGRSRGLERVNKREKKVLWSNREAIHARFQFPGLLILGAFFIG